MNSLVELLEHRVLLSAGDLDPTFGNAGKVILPAGSGTVEYQVNAVAVQQDDKTVLAGSAGAAAVGGRGQFFLERLNADGSVDQSFGSGGIVTASFGRLDAASAIIIQPDGRILVGGSDQTDASGSDAQIALARFSPGGTLDPTFGTGGKVLTHISGSQEVQSLVLTPDGKIVAAGYGVYQDPAHPTGSNYSANVVFATRYNANGSLDKTFNSTGYVYRQYTGFTLVSPAAAVQPDGKVVLCASMNFGVAVWRVNVNGTTDTSFGLGGMTTALGAGTFHDDDYIAASASRILVQPDGKLLVAGPEDVESGVDETWVLGRYNPDGSLDTSFANGGVVTVELQSSGVGPSVPRLALQSDGEILIGGATPTYSGAGPFLVRRYFANGTPDPTYHSANIDFGASSADITFGAVGGMAVAPDGRVVVAGTVSVDSTRLIAVARLQGDLPPAAAAQATASTPAAAPGALDPTFGLQGRELYNDPNPVALPDSLQHRVKAVAVQNDGKIVLAGSIGPAEWNGQEEFYVARLNPDGTLDRSFGTFGELKLDIGAVSFATSLLIQPDGKIVVAGATEDSATNPTDAQFAIARFNQNGSLDTGFGSQGIVVTDFPGNEEVDSLALAPGGKVVAAGAYFLNPNVGFDVARYNANGSLDTSFNGTGMLQYDLGQSGGNSAPVELAVQQDDKILVGAHAANSAAVYRFSASGAIDLSFGSSGIAIETLQAVYSAGTPAHVRTLIVQPDGRVLAGVNARFPGPALVRLNEDGTPDQTFGSNGIVQIPIGLDLSAAIPDPLSQVLLKPDGRIVVAGDDAYSGDDYPVYTVLLRQYLPDGTPDPGFQTDTAPGFIPPPHWGGPLIEAAALGPDGNVVVASDLWASAIDMTTNRPHWIGVARYLDPPNYFQVTSRSDDGLAGSLRWAIDQVNGTAGPATIGFAPGFSGTITLSPTLGALDVTNDSGLVTIHGPGARALTVSGGGKTPVLALGTLFTTNPVDVQVSDLAISTGTTGGFQLPGAIGFRGSLTLTDCTLSDNSAGTISVPYDSNLSVSRCTFVGNTFGIDNAGTLSLDNSTFAGNTAGALLNTGNATVINCTLSGNSSATGGPAQAGGITNTGILKIGNTIVAGNAGEDVSGKITSLGHNLVGQIGASSGWVASDLISADPKLAPLGNYGGPTNTFALLMGSPALDHGDNGLVNPKTDQRGFPRIFGEVDIGAYEAQPPAVAGDVNHDGSVNFADLVLLAQHFGQPVPLWELGDLNGDGKVDFKDLVILAANYG